MTFMVKMIYHLLILNSFWTKFEQIEEHFLVSVRPKKLVRSVRDLALPKILSRRNAQNKQRIHKEAYLAKMVFYIFVSIEKWTLL